MRRPFWRPAERRRPNRLRRRRGVRRRGPPPPPSAGAPSPSAPPPPRPGIVGPRTPFGATRRAQTRAYAKRHYGTSTDRLQPKVIVEHYTVSSTFSSAWNTFASNAPDVELHERPGVCSHFIVD